MKIYNTVVIDIESGEIIYEDSYQWNGSLALARGGGETVVTHEYPEPSPQETQLLEEQLKYYREVAPIEAEMARTQAEYMRQQAELLPGYQKAIEEQYGLAEPYAELMRADLEMMQRLMPVQEQLAQTEAQVAEMNLERARKIAAGEPLATPEQQQELRKMADLFKQEGIAGIEETAEELMKEATREGLRRGIPYSDIARSFEKDVGKWIISERGKTEREAERLYQQGLIDYPTAAAQLGQMLGQPTGGYLGSLTLPPGYQIPSPGMPAYQATGGMDVLNQMLAQLQSERYGMMTETQTGGGMGVGTPLTTMAGGVAGGLAGYYLPEAGATFGTVAGGAGLGMAAGGLLGQLFF